MRKIVSALIVLLMASCLFAEVKDSVLVQVSVKTDNTKVAFTTIAYTEATEAGPSRADKVTMENDGDSTTSKTVTVYASGHSNDPNMLQLTVYGTALTRYTGTDDAMSFTDDVVSTTYSYGNGSSTTVTSAAKSATTPDASGKPQGILVATFKETIAPTALRTLGENAITVKADISQALQGDYAAVLTLVCEPASA